MGDREEDGAGEFYGEKDRKKRAGKKDWKRRTGKGGSAERLGRNAQSGETIQKKHGGRKFCAQPKAGSTVVEGGTSEKIL